jgi:hypothetical protein
VTRTSRSVLDFAEPVEMTFLQVSRDDKVIIEQLGVSQDVTAEFTASGEKLRTFIEVHQKTYELYVL